MPRSSNDWIIKPHGGVLIDRIMGRQEVENLETSGLIKLNVLDDFILDIEKIAIGAYSPLKGFMCRDDFSEVVHSMRLKDKTVWTIPIFLPVDEKTAKCISRGDRVLICNKDNHEIALMDVKDIFSFPKDKWTEKVYGTKSREHPGVDRVYSSHEKLIGGDIWMINKPRFKFEKFNLSPAETRREIKTRGWRTVSGFQTRNVPHRAHEYLQKIALSVTDGILIHPIIGWKKAGDFKPEIIIKTYDILIRNYFPKGSVIFAGLATAMRYAGPREAVFHAIIRKNYGCTHFVVGRDHAGAGKFYGKYDAHLIFDTLPEIGIAPLLLNGPYYCKRCGDVVSEKICPHPERYRVHISGTNIRRLIGEGKDLPQEFVRPEVGDVLAKYGKKAFL